MAGLREQDRSDFSTPRTAQSLLSRQRFRAGGGGNLQQPEPNVQIGRANPINWTDRADQRRKGRNATACALSPLQGGKSRTLPAGFCGVAPSKSALYTVVPRGPVLPPGCELLLNSSYLMIRMIGKEERLGTEQARTLAYVACCNLVICRLEH